jgi:hypothetical protein
LLLLLLQICFPQQPEAIRSQSGTSLIWAGGWIDSAHVSGRMAWTTRLTETVLLAQRLHLKKEEQARKEDESTVLLESQVRFCRCRFFPTGD